jgi:integrase/recombinase XerD
LLSSVSTSTISNYSPILDRKIEETVNGINKCYGVKLRSIEQHNTAAIVDYIAAMRVEINLSDSYREDNIDTLIRLSNYHNNKPFKDLIRTDIVAFLDSLRKTEIQDPMHKWIGTYNLFRIYLLRFFKWLYYPDIEPKKRHKPAVVENIAQLKRKEKSIYKPSDLWTQQDDLLFLKYCPTKREKCYHAISRDTSCRPHEILKLKIKDVIFKTSGSYQYAEVLVNGKTGSRAIPLIDSIPYLKDYLDHAHPQPGNRNSPLVSGTGRALGLHISVPRIYSIYVEFKKQIFPKLLESPNVLPEDKPKIRELLKKPWNPYIRRHSALTEKSTILKEHVLRQHAGWSGSSQMHLKYLHYFGNESSESLLEAYGIIDKGIQIDQLSPKQCPNCSEPNKPDSKFCAKCRMVLTYDAYNETLENEKEKEDDITTLKRQMRTILSTLQSLDLSSRNQMAEQLIQKGVYKSVD